MGKLDDGRNTITFFFLVILYRIVVFIIIYDKTCIFDNNNKNNNNSLLTTFRTAHFNIGEVPPLLGRQAIAQCRIIYT